MNFRLIDSGWDREIEKAVATDHSELRVMCPFIKVTTVQRLLKCIPQKSIHVITRFHLSDFYNGVSDIAALSLLLKNGAKIRGVQNLHSKLYIFGQNQAIVTSANLTEAALTRNHEFGFVAKDSAIIKSCSDYFDKFWDRITCGDLTQERLDNWGKKVRDYIASGSKPSRPSGLGDEGFYLGIPAPSDPFSPWAAENSQAYVKFFGEGHYRTARKASIFKEIKRSGCHWACTYPAGKRPKQVSDQDIMFMGRLVKDPNDILIFGRALATQHEELSLRMAHSINRTVFCTHSAKRLSRLLPVIVIRRLANVLHKKGPSFSNQYHQEF